MSEHGHDTLEAYYTEALRKRIGDTWASIMRCQDGDDFDEAGSDESRKNPKHPYLAVLAKHITDKNARILEVGAGDGSETRMFMDNGYKNITGITIGNKNVERGRDKYGVNLIYEDMHFMSFDNELFDYVIGFQTYEHTPAPLLLGLEFMRVLKPGGKVILEVPTGAKHFTLDNNPHHVNVFDAWQGPRMLMKCGFENVGCDQYDISDGERRYVFYGEKIGRGNHNNHFNDVVAGKFNKGV